MSTEARLDQVRHVLLDRDGVLVVEEPGADPMVATAWRWIPGSREAIVALHRSGIATSVVTNQACIGLGTLDAASLDVLHRAVAADVAAHGGGALPFHVCPHAPDAGCACRKPAPGLVAAAVTTSAIPADATVLVGDAARDLQAAQAFGVAAVLVRTGKGAQTEQDPTAPRVPTYDDLASAVAGITGVPVEVAPDASPALSPTAIALAEHLHVAEASAAAGQHVAAAASLLWDAFEQGGTVLACGNGGSAADASHFVAELVGRYRTERRPLRALALGADAPTASALANDLGYADALAREVAALAQPGDVLVALSTSGSSPNVLAAVRAAKAAGCQCIGLTGADGHTLAELADLALVVPSTTVARIQEVHALWLHAIAEDLEGRAG